MKIGSKYIVTTDNWFYGKDGQQYRAVFGTLKGIFDDKKTLGVSTNRNSTNWYAQIGGVLVAGCQIHYCVECDVFPTGVIKEVITENGVTNNNENPCRVYNGDE